MNPCPGQCQLHGCRATVGLDLGKGRIGCSHDISDERGDTLEGRCGPGFCAASTTARNHHRGKARPSEKGKSIPREWPRLTCLVRTVETNPRRVNFCAVSTLSGLIDQKRRTLSAAASQTRRLTICKLLPIKSRPRHTDRYWANGSTTR